MDDLRRDEGLVPESPDSPNRPAGDEQPTEASDGGLNVSPAAPSDLEDDLPDFQPGDGPGQTPGE